MSGEWVPGYVVKRLDHWITVTSAPRLHNHVAGGWPPSLDPETIHVSDCRYPDGTADRRVTVLGRLLTRGRPNPIERAEIAYTPDQLRLIPRDLGELIVRVAGVVPIDAVTEDTAPR
jgi:hypothetical protein